MTSGEEDASFEPDWFDAKAAVVGAGELADGGVALEQERPAEEVSRNLPARHVTGLEHLLLAGLLEQYTNTKRFPLVDAKAALARLDREVARRYAGMNYNDALATRRAGDSAWRSLNLRVQNEEDKQRQRDKLALERVARAAR